MSPILRHDHDHGVVRLQLRNGRGNPLTPDVLDALLTQLQALHDSPPRALVLDAGGASVFSGGFALPVIVGYDRPALRDFFSRFTEILDLVLRLPCASITAVSGHAVAAGFILSLASDFRVVRKAPLKLGLPEVDLGVAVPAETQLLFAARTSPQHALRCCSDGQLFDADEAWRIGYADRLAEDADAEGLAWATALATKPGSGVGVGRLFTAADLADRVKAASERFGEAFLDSWFSDEGQRLLQAQARKLAGG